MDWDKGGTAVWGAFRAAVRAESWLLPLLTLERTQSPSGLCVCASVCVCAQECRSAKFWGLSLPSGIMKA